tara:strand:- start:9026 stop:10399 length:1374 start_codon:yes stop_codon:yes gene_type:complete
MASTISTPAATNVNVVASVSTDPTSPYYTKKNLNEKPGSFLTQATMLVYDDILRFQDAAPQTNILITLTPKQKNSIYFAIKRIYEPMYGKGSSSTELDDETYFNYLKGYVGSFFYKEYDWWNKDDDLGWGEFILINGGNALYQVFDIIFEGESVTEAFTDLIEQGRGTFQAAQNKKDIRDALKGKIAKLHLYNDDMSVGPIVWVGFDNNGDIVVYDVDPALPTGKSADLTNFRYDTFEGNILWFMDEIVGMESDWIQNASPGIAGNTAYGYVQFTEPAVTTKAISLYKQKLARFNARKDTRNWRPPGIPKGTIIPVPIWLLLLEKTVTNGSYKHISQMNILSYDEMLALALINMHYGKITKDSDWVELETGSVAAAKRIYLRDHHAALGGATDQDTLDRLNTDGGGFFQIHYKQAKTLTQKVMDHTPAFTLAKAILASIRESKYAKHIETVKGWFGW